MDTITHWQVRMFRDLIDVTDLPDLPRNNLLWLPVQFDRFEALIHKAYDNRENTISWNDERVPMKNEDYVYSPYFIHWNTNKNKTIIQEKMGRRRFRFLGKPYDNYRSRSVSTLVFEEEHYTEIVLDQSGIVMITKALGDKQIRNTHEFSSKMKTDGHPPTKRIPKIYDEVVDELIEAYQRTFSDGVVKL
jgi:hypothetical protein